MSRPLLRSLAFARDLRAWLKSHPGTAESLKSTLEQLSADAAHPSLRTHKLRGTLANCWACSAGYDVRVVFEFCNMRMPKPSCCWLSERMTKCIRPSRPIA